MKKSIFFLLAGILTIFQIHAQLTVPTTPQNRGVLIEDFHGGIHSGFSPDASRIGDDIRATNSNVSFVEIHAGPFSTPSAGQVDLRTPIGDMIHAAPTIPGYPMGAVNRTVFAGQTQPVTSRSFWTTNTSILTTTPSPVNIVADGYYDATKGELTVSVAMYYTSTVTTSHYLNVFLVQDEIHGYQSQVTPYPARILPNGDYNHKDIFRDALTGAWGQLITGSTTMGSRIDESFTYTPKTIGGIAFDAPNMKIIAFISEGNNYNNEIVTCFTDPDLLTGTPPPGPTTYSISGTTMLGGNASLADTRRVYLITQDTSVATLSLTKVDSIDAKGGGLFSFSGLSNGTYYLQSAVALGQPNYSNYIPSYRWQEELWTNASPIVLFNADQTNQNVDLTASTATSGVGLIAGTMTASGTTNPIGGVNVILYDDSGNPLAYKVTDSNGKYNFPNLPIDCYNIYVDILNKISTPIRVCLTTTDPTADSVDISVGTGITPTGIEKQSVFGKLLIYPNQ